MFGRPEVPVVLLCRRFWLQTLTGIMTTPSPVEILGLRLSGLHAVTSQVLCSLHTRGLAPAGLGSSARRGARADAAYIRHTDDTTMARPSMPSWNRPHQTGLQVAAHQAVSHGAEDVVRSSMAASSTRTEGRDACRVVV